MSVLITGGAGFIGNALCEALLQKNEHVICADNFYLGSDDNIKRFQENENFTFYNTDVCDLPALNKIAQTHNIDFVYHLAANSDIQSSAENPAVEFENTLTTTFSVLEMMRLNSIKKLFFASTSAVYGDKTYTALSEDTTALAPVSYYGGAKLSSEALIHAYSYMNGISSLVLRFPNVIGPRLTHGVIFDFINKLKANPKQLNILGDGTQRKPYMHVYDLINAIMLLKDGLNDGVNIFNAGVETKTTVTKIADIICDVMNLKNVEYVYSGGNVGWRGDVPTFSYDLSKIHKTGWRASLTSDESVAKTVKEILS